MRASVTITILSLLLAWPQGQATADEQVWTRLHTDAPGKVRALLENQNVDVTGSHHRLGFVDMLTSPEERDRILARHGARLLSAESLDLPKALSDYHDPLEISALMDQIQASYPAIAQKILLAEGLPEGHTILAMKISDNVEVDEDEPVFLMDGQTHAREVMTSEVMIDAMDRLTSLYGSDPQVTRWVDDMEIWIVPVVNPDGAAYVHSRSAMWRKNRNAECGSQVGVDLNRNFSWNYRQCSGSSSNCPSDTYHGTGPASELETQTMEALMDALRPMYYINYHSYGEYILWASGCGVSDEQELFFLVGNDLNHLVEDDSGETGQWAIGPTALVLYTAPGGASDTAYGAHGAIGFTIELNRSGFQPDYERLRDVTVTRQREAWGYLMDRTLDGPSVVGHTFDSETHEPVQASYQFANHPFTSGQWPLWTDASGRFGRAVLPDSEQVLIFTAPGYLPETRTVVVGSGPLAMEVPLTAGLNHPPVAHGGDDQIADEGQTVTLDASRSTDPDGNALYFTWTQTSGPAVLALENATSAYPTFFAPPVNEDTTITLQVVASDGELSSEPAGVTITVRDRWNETTAFSSEDTPLHIPDNDPVGVTSIINIEANQPILRTAVHVDITHTWIGDLRVSLTSPSGTTAVLHDHTGGSTHDLHGDYQPPQFVGELSGGDWILFMEDSGPRDLGVLEGWTLSLDLVGLPGCTSPDHCHLPHVDQHVCQEGLCAIASCSASWADCNIVADDGCEIALHTDSDCAACGDDCAQAFPQATGACLEGRCTMDSCLEGHDDCNASADDGCETALGTDQACGGCHDDCTQMYPGSTGFCQEGLCQPGTCEQNYGDCNDDPSDGCETPLGTDTACKGCLDNCLNDFAHATGACEEGTCRIASCRGGYGDCNGQEEDGCETTLGTDTDCRACKDDCEGLFPNATASCIERACQMDACAEGFGDCNDEDGCETILGTIAHCGACDDACSYPHAAASCQDGACLMGPCANGYGDCNMNPDDGCETSLGTVTHCGACDDTCSYPHAAASCQKGACLMGPCAEGYGDCNMNPGDGCETILGTVTHCGACDDTCSYPHAAASCQDGACSMDACAEGYGDCNMNPADGCETALGTVTHCGACDDTCSYPHAAASCQDGACGMDACAEGYGDCNMNPADGCETPLGTESDCAGCGEACKPDSATGICQDGACTIGECHSAFGNCNDDDADGCETPLDTLTDCGACHAPCAVDHGTGLCIAGACVIGGCEPGFGDCDGLDDNGCEADLTVAARCGGCQAVCLDQEECVEENGAFRCLCREGEDCGGEKPTDQDGDGYCAGPNCPTENLDCHDGDSEIHPGAAEICGDGLDNDCDGQVDQGCEEIASAQGCGCTLASGEPLQGLGGLLLLMGLWGLARLGRRRT